MNIFSIFSSKKFMKICSKTHQIELFKKNSPGKHAPNPPSYATRSKQPRGMQLAQPPKSLHPPPIEDLYLRAVITLSV